jgi:LuxR family maltose regulon positive regulatory protein
MRPTTVVRRELIDFLDRATTKKVTIISAPPGSGKTTLLRICGPTARQPAGGSPGVSVRRGEKDPQHFWLSLVEAERAVSTPNGPVGSLLGRTIISFAAGAILGAALFETAGLESIALPTALAALALAIGLSAGRDLHPRKAGQRTHFD